MNKNTMGIAGIALIVGLGVGYVGANAMRQAAPTQNVRGNFSGANGGTFIGMRGGMGNGSFLAGTVAAKDSGSITINTRDGSSHVVLITPATNVSKSVSGTMDDVSVGSTIIVSGTTNSDGSVSASLIQLRPTPPPAAQ
ncbi:MAG: hypothetical protein ACYC75_01240 [Minisyncoccota bacterium]